MRVVIDTCVWVAAVRSRQGASFVILSEISGVRFRFGVSVPLFLEYQSQMMNAVGRAKSGLSKSQMATIVSALAHYGVEVPIYFRLRPNLKDENDNMVFECAANFGAEAIVTHNVRDFRNPELRGYGIEIMKPNDFLRRIRRIK
jgi:putative PIN family toxin of toxin-antitoxin system